MRQQNDALFWGMLRDRPNYQQQGFIPSPSSPTSSTASKCRGIRRGTKQKNSQKVWLCCCYCSSSSSSFVTSIGVFILVLAYTVLGAFIFMALEGGFSAAKSFEVSEKALAKTDASDKKQKLISNEEIRLQTVEKLWSITEDLNILYKENWTRLATQEVLKFQESLVRTFKNYGSSVSVRTGSLKEETAVYYTHHQHRWSFASSFLYSLTVITTIGSRLNVNKGTVTEGPLLGFPWMYDVFGTSRSARSAEKVQKSFAVCLRERKAWKTLTKYFQGPEREDEEH
ncbi:hypothetical protein RUM43_010109 [Polyplax serrata]|uniref:Uncharacterized protein n=1 Tax=Polyplax serrata TaxID=468196 RepID=A0AAN8S7V6_POLSC